MGVIEPESADVLARRSDEHGAEGAREVCGRLIAAMAASIERAVLGEVAAEEGEDPTALSFTEGRRWGGL